MEAKITVIIPSYNRASVLPRALNSVFAQTRKVFEVIVVNDGSTDNTSEVLSPYLKFANFKSITTSNRGVSAARNRAIREARGEWLAFLDSDDEWLPDKLALQMALADSQPETPLIHGEEIWIRKGVRVNPMKKHQKKGGDVFEDALRFCCISPSTVLIKKTLLEETGLFREDFPVCEDYDLWLKITSRYPVGFVSDFLIKKYGGHEDQLSQKFRAMDYWRVLALGDLLDGELRDDQRELARAELRKKAEILLKGYKKHGNLENYDQIFQILNSH